MMLSSAGRLFLVLTHQELMPAEGEGWIWKIFWKGWQFDSTIASYLVAIPFLVLGIFFLINKKSISTFKVINSYVILLFVSITTLVISDLPYFNFYNSRLTKGVLTWMDKPGAMMESLLGEDDYYIYILLAAVIIAALLVLSKRLYLKILLSESKHLPLLVRIPIFLICGFILFLGVRGDSDFSNKPITSESAFISEFSFVNQMAMNPVFNFFDSFRVLEIAKFSEEEAIEMAAKYLGSSEGESCSPIYRTGVGKNDTSKPNIVLVLVESLTSYKVGVAGGEDLTPYIDSLAQNGLFFSNFYSNGVHTHNGIYSTLYGIPAVLHNKPMSDSYISQLKHDGMVEELRSKGYQTRYFCSGDLNFDNMGAFLSSHGFEKVFGRDQYKKEDIYSSWGLSDHTLYEYAMREMDACHETGEPFFTTILTIASHDGYYPPKVEGFEPKDEKRDNHRYEYTDWSLGRFIRGASEKDWFGNTVFVILGDHGQNFNPIYDLPLSYVQIPMIIYSPLIDSAFTYPKLGAQIDLFPTLMGLLGMSYKNNTFGLDLLKEERPYVYFCNDDYLGCLDTSNYLLIRNTGHSVMFDYRSGSTTNILTSQSKKAEAMESYMYSMLQTTQYMMKNNLLARCAP